VNSRLETLDMAGLEAVAVDVEAFALQRVLLECRGKKTPVDETIAILDIGAVKTDVNIVASGQFALTRNIQIAGDHFTNAIKVTKKCDWNTAEKIKKQVDMSALLESDADPERLSLAKAIQPVLDELLREIRRSTNYYHTQISERALQIPEVDEPREVTRLMVTGGSGLLKGIDRYMSARLGSPVETWNVFDNPSIIADNIASEFVEQNHSVLALCVSLALKDVSAVPAIGNASPKNALRMQTDQEEALTKAA
jgi:type IV pilus assembly protein PilM